MSSHWTEIARKWKEVGPPLKPSSEDLAHYGEAIGLWKGARPPRILILGVTQELYWLACESGGAPTAVDISQPMIDNVWPGAPGSAHCADWRSMPIATGSQDIAASDGGITLLPYPDGVADLASELRRVLADNSLCVFRLYVPPMQRESAGEVLNDLAAGCIPNLSSFKLRMWAAMQENPRDGVCLHEVWSALNAFAPDRNGLAGQIGWQVEHLAAIDTYRGSRDTYWLPTQAEVTEIFTDAGCQPAGVWQGAEERTALVAFGSPDAA